MHKRGIKQEREFANMNCNENMHCERVAGSGSRLRAVCDAILMQNGKTALVEIKSTKLPVFYVRGHVKEQLNEMRKICSKINHIPILAIKFSRQGWFYAVVDDHLPSVLEPRTMKAYEINKLGGVFYENNS